MDARYITAFLEATKAVFGTMLKLPVTFEKPELTPGGQPFDVSGIIGLSGDVTGSVIVGFSRLSAVQVASALAGSRLEFGSADFADAVGEITNMIAGRRQVQDGRARHQHQLSHGGHRAQPRHP
jgi:chemotaxis protein CheX